jgi:hypothetical protein
MKYQVLLFSFFILITDEFVCQVAEPNEMDKASIVKAVNSWADSTFFKFDEPRFEHFVAHYTDEFIIASMRSGSLNKSIKRLEAAKEKETFEGSESDYDEAMSDLLKRKDEAHAALINFSPKVTHYSVIFWANIKLDSGIYNYVKHEVFLNEQFNVVKSDIVGNIGDNSSGKIIYK